MGRSDLEPEVVPLFQPHPPFAPVRVSHRSPQYFGWSPHMRPEPNPTRQYRLSERSAHSKLSTSLTVGDHFVGDELWVPPPRPQEHRRPPCRGWSRLGVMEGEAARRRRSWKHYNAPNRPFQNPAKTARWRPLGDHFQKSRSPTTRLEPAIFSQSEHVPLIKS